MKILRINNHKAEYSIDGTNYSSIVNINKEILKIFIDKIMSCDTIFLDEEDENKEEESEYKPLFTSETTSETEENKESEESEKEEEK